MVLPCGEQGKAAPVKEVELIRLRESKPHHPAFFIDDAKIISCLRVSSRVYLRCYIRFFISPGGHFCANNVRINTFFSPL